MRKPADSPSLGEDLATLGELYLTFLWMLRQRLYYGPSWQYRHRLTPAHTTAGREAEGAEAPTADVAA